MDGSITNLGSKYVLSLHARNCRTGEILGQAEARVAKSEDVVKALRQMAKRFGTRIGPSLPRVEKQPDLSAENTTRSSN